MTTSSFAPPARPEQVYVWAWLPGASDPVVAGVLTEQEGIIVFAYGRSYLARTDAIPLYLPELPLQTGPIPPRVGTIAGCISDSAPDAWGMRVILQRVVGGNTDDVDLLHPFTYLVESGSQRIGALDFQHSADRYIARGTGVARLDDLARAAELVEAGVEQRARCRRRRLLGRGCEVGYVPHLPRRGADLGSRGGACRRSGASRAGR